MSSMENRRHSRLHDGFFTVARNTQLGIVFDFEIDI